MLYMYQNLNVSNFPDNRFPTCRRILMQKQQTTFENIVDKGEIAHEQQLTIKLSFMEIFRFFVTMFPKSSAADLLYVFKHLSNVSEQTAQQIS